MKLPRKYVIPLLWINTILALAGYIGLSLVETGISYVDMLLLLAAFSLISLVIVIIFHRGQEKESGDKVVHTLVSMGLKFLLDLVLALLWFVVGKKNSVESVFIFFVLYLSLTLFSAIYILKTLKIRSL